MSQISDTATAPTLSTITSRDDSHEEDGELENAIEFFEEHIWHNHRVCTNCFARVRRSQTYTVDDWGNEDEETWRSGDATLGETSDVVRHRGTVTVRNENNAVTGVTSREPARGTTRHEARTTCTECGSVGAIKQFDTLSEQAAVDRVPALVERLREQGFAVDESTVYGVVRMGKSNEDWEAHDKEIFATAASLGINGARA